MRKIHFSGGRRAGKRLARALRLVQSPVLDAPSVHREGAESEPSPTEHYSTVDSGLYRYAMVDEQRPSSTGDSVPSGETQVSGRVPYRFSQIPVRTRNFEAEYWRLEPTASSRVVGLAQEQEQLDRAWQQQIHYLSNPVWITSTPTINHEWVQRLYVSPDAQEIYYHIPDIQWTKWEPVDPDLVMDIGL